MYGKVFESMYEGTLYGQWEAIVTMQQFIVLATADGVVDMTPMVISAKTSIPREILDKGIDILSKPDPYSRTPGNDGIRIRLIDDHKPWGWYIVNHDKYSKMVKGEDKRLADRIRIKNKRKSLNTNSVANVANVAQEEEDVKEDKDTKRGAKRCPPKYQPSSELLDSLCAETGFVTPDLMLMLREMKDHEFDKAKKDWDAVFRNWVRRDRKWRKDNVGETTFDTADSLAAQLGLTRLPNEPDEQFKHRVANADTAKRYGQ